MVMLAGSFISCEDALDLTPENSLTFRNALETEKDLEGVLSGVGYYMRQLAINGTCQLMKGAYMDFDPHEQFTSERTLAPDGGEVDGMGWGRFYDVITQANVVLHFADQVKMTDARRKVYKGQAYFYKGLMYLELLRRWGDVIMLLRWRKMR